MPVLHHWGATEWLGPPSACPCWHGGDSMHMETWTHSMECHLVTCWSCCLNLPLLWHLVRCGKTTQNTIKTPTFSTCQDSLCARSGQVCPDAMSLRGASYRIAVNQEFSLSKVVIVIPGPKFEPTLNGNLQQILTPSSERFQASHSKLLCMLANETDPVTNDSPVKKRITHPMNSWHDGLKILEGQTEQSQTGSTWWNVVPTSLALNIDINWRKFGCMKGMRQK